MKQIDKPYIRKTYELNEQDLIIISLEDIRDNNIENNALGKIGDICIAKGYLQATPSNDELENKKEKQKILDEAITEIFGTSDINLITSIAYETIKGMIYDGTIETLGYEQRAKKEEYLFDIDYFGLNKQNIAEFAGFNFADEEYKDSDLEKVEPIYKPRKR